jgi:hypothetical protein
MDGAIARLLFAVAFSKPSSDSFSIGVSAAVIAAPTRRAAGTGAVRSGIRARDVWFVMAGPGGCHRDW